MRRNTAAGMSSSGERRSGFALLDKPAVAPYGNWWGSPTKLGLGARRPTLILVLTGKDELVTPKEVLALCREKNVKAVDLRFMDFPGLWQHFTIPVNKLDEEVFEDGLGFDGSSIRGWQAINESDMLVVPQPETASLDPFCDDPHAVDDLQHPGPDHPRGLLARSRATSPARPSTISRAPASPTPPISARRPSSSSSTTCASTRTRNEGYYHVDSIEGEWNRGREENPNLGYKLRYKEGYFPVPPADQMMNIRNEMMQTMIDCGIDIEAQHHEVATAGQSEIDMRFDKLVTMADKMMLYKYIIKNVAKKYNKTVTFMPKPLFGDNGSGMHTHISIWKGDEPLFAGNGMPG